MPLIIIVGLFLHAFVPTSMPTALRELTVRNAHAIAYDSDRGRVLLFGGADEQRVLGNLWAWDGRAWTLLAQTGPQPRTFPSMAYDSHRKHLVLYGGNRVLFGSENAPATFLDDTWEWNGEGWKRLEVSGPSARAEAAVAYDAVRRRVVLFGGYRTSQGETVRLGDTWEWDGRRWEQRSPSGPSPRNGAAMAYDTARQRVVLFGGSGATGDTWEWDGREWHRIASADAPGRFNVAMAYDGARRRVVRFGGWNRKERTRGTWIYDGRTWTQVADDGPPPRNHAAMAYDEGRKRLVLFGGHDGPRVLGDMWEWDGERWTLVRPFEPRDRVDNGH